MIQLTLYSKGLFGPFHQMHYRVLLPSLLYNNPKHGGGVLKVTTVDTTPITLQKHVTITPDVNLNHQVSIY